jgi:hypothetical protein
MIGVHPLTVNVWIRTTPVDGANPSASSAGRVIDFTSPPRFVAVEVRQNLTARSSAAATPGDWPEIVAPNDGSCGFPLGLSSVGSVSFWPSCPRAELPLEHTGLPRSRGHGFEEILRPPGGRRPRVASTRSALGSLVRFHQLADEPHQDPVLGQHGLVALCQTSGGRDSGLAGVTNSVDQALQRGADTAAQRH